jgi:crotonobetainyl-CoA:carnitine CoA-transferase CaiB-like acyl-CoA transferase
MTGPLAGIRVLDLTTNVAGPSATMILADLGADTVKVERPDGGDDGREMGPHRDTWGAYFVAVNRGKRSIALDLRRPEGRQAVLRLARRSDVLVENFRGGRAASLGLDEAAVRAVRPDIIYASLTAFGPRGPDHEKPGYDGLLQARTGIASVTGAPGGPPARAGVSILDMGSGVWTALGILAALYERRGSGRGQRVDSSLYQTGVMWMAYHLLYRQFTGRDPGPQGTRHEAFAPYGDFPASDGAILIGVANDALFARLSAAVGRPGWPGDPRFAFARARLENRAALESELAAVTRTRPAAEWLKRLEEHGVPAAPLQTAGELLDDPQLAAVGQLAGIDLAGLRVRVPRLPFELSATPGGIAGPPPRLGEHGKEILAEAGFAEGEIRDLAARGVLLLP